MKVDVVIADFIRLDDVRRAAAKISETYPAIDVLINCAGLHNTHRQMTPDGNEMTFQVNHLASFLLTMSLLNSITKSPQGRIIQVNSEGHRFGGLHLRDLDWQIRFYMGLRAYGASKLAQLMTVHTLAGLLSETDVTVNAMHPGTVGTYIGSNNGILHRGMMALGRKIFKPPTISGEALYYLAAAPELKDVTGKYFFLTVEATPMADALDDTAREEIWAKSLELTGLTQAL